MRQSKAEMRTSSKLEQLLRQVEVFGKNHKSRMKRSLQTNFVKPTTTGQQFWNFEDMNGTSRIHSYKDSIAQKEKIKLK